MYTKFGHEIGISTFEPIHGQMPAIPESVAGYLSELIQSCWDMDPHVSTSIRRLSAHTYIAVYILSAVQSQSVQFYYTVSCTTYCNV